MSDRDLALLARTLDLWTHMHPKMRPDPNSPGVARLDHYSGLFLKRDSDEGRWLLEARTWGHPAPQSVHDWYVRAASAVHQLDPTVTLPDRLPATLPETQARPLGWVAHKRLARIRRRIAALR